MVPLSMCFVVVELCKKTEPLPDFNFEINEVDFSLIFILPAISFLQIMR